MLSIKTEKVKNTVVIFLEGDLMIETTQELSYIFAEEMKKGPKAIGVNCQDIVTIDSFGLGTLIKFAQKSVMGNIEFALTDVSESVGKLLKLSKLEHFFSIMSDEEFEISYLVDDDS
ncbi:MAG: STAS domain-containing protein [bacterium]|nr:STAS domain-containing protein [bacterium]